MLTKSLFLAGRQCQKRLWLQLNRPDLAKARTTAEQARISTGQILGNLAHELFESGVLVETATYDPVLAAETTRQLIGGGAPTLFEAAFLVDGLFARCDVLAKREGEWHIVEVKSSTRVKDQHYEDLAFQCVVLGRAGILVEKCFVCHVNSSATLLDDPLTAQDMLVLSEVTVEVNKLKAKIEGAISSLVETARSTIQPEIETNTHCNNPVTCPFYGHCHETQPANDLTFLPGIRPEKVKALRAEGFRTIDQIPETEKFSVQQRRMWETIKFNTSYVGADLGSELAKIQFPAHFIDFEAAGPAFPLYRGTRPYQQFPFQWSSHWLATSDGEAKELGFLHTTEDDPRPLFARSLYEAIKDARTVVFYSAYETTAVRSLAAANVPYGQELVEILTTRGFDLYKLVREQLYFPAFRGSFSIKKVLPALVPGLDYKDLAIADGDTAAVEYLRMRSPSISAEDRDEIADALRQYCSRDTLAMVELYRALCQLSRPAVTF